MCFSGFVRHCEILTEHLHVHLIRTSRLKNNDDKGFLKKKLPENCIMPYCVFCSPFRSFLFSKMVAELIVRTTHLSFVCVCCFFYAVPAISRLGRMAQMGNILR